MQGVFMTVEKLRSVYPDLFFIRTKRWVEKPDYNQLKEAFIPDEDSSSFPLMETITSDTRIYPLSITEYPGVLKRMTAMEAGAWAISKCGEQHWPVNFKNIQCCLANLEMDY